MTSGAGPAPRARIDAGAFRHNLQQVRQYCPGARIMAVIKANAYGHDAEALLSACADADACAVARVSGGEHLRQLGWRGRIVVLGGARDGLELSAAVHHGMDLVVHAHYQLELLEAFTGSGSIDLWLKFDSGMHRLGFDATGFAAAAQRLSALACVSSDVRLMTHLACADQPGNEHTYGQLDAFAQQLANSQAERSIANSAGVLAWPASHADWVRPGLMLYGVSPFADSTGPELGLRAVMTLETRLVAVKVVRAGEAVGYGATWVAQRDTRVGIAAIGYGDGYPWRLSMQGKPGVVLINGQRCALVGRVSMDMIAMELDHLPQAGPGDRVVLWGDGLPVEEVAARAGTIPYELLCGIAHRVPR